MDGFVITVEFDIPHKPRQGLVDHVGISTFGQRHLRISRQ